MGTLAKAAALLQDREWENWMMAAAVYQARAVVLEDATIADHAVRLRMATVVIGSPRAIVAQLSSVIATIPAIASTAVVSKDAEGRTVVDLSGVNENTVITEVANAWTKLAQLMYPAAA